jgi:LCP family protein required for cell wall assembly
MKKRIKKTFVKNVPKEAKRYDVGKTLSTQPVRSVRLNGSRSNDEVRSEPTVEPVKNRVRKWLVRFVLFVFLAIIAAVLLIGIWDFRNLNSFSQKMFDSNPLGFLSQSDLKMDENGRVNVLVAGYSADDPGHAGANLTDSIMLLSMDPGTKTGYMLSIPRDLYVKIPGYGAGKINEAYSDGGMPLLVQIVEQDFGVSIGYYALVNYASVRDSVSALHGIDVIINSPEGRLYDPNKDWSTGGPLVDLTNGRHHLNGQQALDLTRARGDPSPYGIAIGFGQSDFQRTADQRLVFTAIKDKLNWKLVLDPRKNSQILDAFASNIKTNLTASEARPLFTLFNGIPSDKLKSLSLRELDGKNYLVSTQYAGSTLSPAAGTYDFSDIQSALSQF